MWPIYYFKLAYAEDNSFELRVNTDWTCSEFVEKVTAVARVTFPSISVTDVMHVTESWNQINDPNYNQMPSEENAPIPLISQTLSARYYPNNPRGRCFYVYFRDECQSIQLRYSRNEPRTIEQVQVSIDYYYDIWVGELDYNNNIIRNRNTTTYQMPTGSYHYNRETSDRSDTIQWGWTGMNSQYPGGLTVDSQAISLDDMIRPSGQDENVIDAVHLPRNLLDDFENQATAPTNFNETFPQLDRNDIYNYTNHDVSLWTIPENIIINPLGFNYIEPEIRPYDTILTDCCICFNEGTQCITLEHCNHSVCVPCYTGVYTRVNGDIDLRCPMCRTPNSFNNDIYRQISALQTHL